MLKQCGCIKFPPPATALPTTQEMAIVMVTSAPSSADEEQEITPQIQAMLDERAKLWPQTPTTADIQLTVPEMRSPMPPRNPHTRMVNLFS